MCVQSDLTYELFIPLVNGEVPECSGNRTDDPVHLHPEQLDEDGQALLLPHRRPDVDARLPVARGQVLNRAGGRLQRLRVGAVGEQVEVRLHNLDNLVTLWKVKVKNAKKTSLLRMSKGESRRIYLWLPEQIHPSQVAPTPAPPS